MTSPVLLIRINDQQLIYGPHKSAFDMVNCALLFRQLGCQEVLLVTIQLSLMEYGPVSWKRTKSFRLPVPGCHEDSEEEGNKHSS